jgi:hypothetical protein
MNDHDLIDEYLDDLLVELRGDPRLARRALAEAEDHLREAVKEARAGGEPEEEAQRAAIERFGSPRLVARRFRPAGGEASRLARFAVGALQVIGIGLTAVGFSGLLVLAMWLLLGPTYVVGFDASLSSVGPPEFCRQLLQQYPSAGSCAEAFQQSLLTGELMFRLVPGAAGIVVLGILWLVSRRWIGRRLLLPARSAAWILIVAGIVVATSLSTGQYPGMGDHMAGTLSALAVVATCAASLRARSWRRAPGTASS